MEEAPLFLEGRRDPAPTNALKQHVVDFRLAWHSPLTTPRPECLLTRGDASRTDLSR